MAPSNLLKIPSLLRFNIGSCHVILFGFIAHSVLQHVAAFVTLGTKRHAVHRQPVQWLNKTTTRARPCRKASFWMHAGLEHASKARKMLPHILRQGVTCQAMAVTTDTNDVNIKKEISKWPAWGSWGGRHQQPKHGQQLQQDWMESLQKWSGGVRNLFHIGPNNHSSGNISHNSEDNSFIDPIDKLLLFVRDALQVLGEAPGEFEVEARQKIEEELAKRKSRREFMEHLNTEFPRLRDLETEMVHGLLDVMEARGRPTKEHIQKQEQKQILRRAIAWARFVRVSAKKSLANAFRKIFKKPRETMEAEQAELASSAEAQIGEKRLNQKEIQAKEEQVHEEWIEEFLIRNSKWLSSFNEYVQNLDAKLREIENVINSIENESVPHATQAASTTSPLTSSKEILATVRGLRIVTKRRTDYWKTRLRWLTWYDRYFAEFKLFPIGTDECDVRKRKRLVPRFFGRDCVLEADMREEASLRPGLEEDLLIDPGKVQRRVSNGNLKGNTRNNLPHDSVKALINDGKFKQRFPQLRELETRIFQQLVQELVSPEKLEHLNSHRKLLKGLVGKTFVESLLPQTSPDARDATNGDVTIVVKEASLTDAEQEEWLQIHRLEQMYAKAGAEYLTSTNQWLQGIRCTLKNIDRSMRKLSKKLGKLEILESKLQGAESRKSELHKIEATSSGPEGQLKRPMRKLEKELRILREEKQKLRHECAEVLQNELRLEVAVLGLAVKRRASFWEVRLPFLLAKLDYDKEDRAHEPVNVWQGMRKTIAFYLSRR